MHDDRAHRICLFGAAPDTANLGVSALCFATLEAIARRAPLAEVTVFDNGWGVRRARTRLRDADFSFLLCGARHSRRYHRPESLWNMRVCAWLGGLKNPGALAVAGADAVLDSSAGDSFTDLYGMRRFRAITLPKRIAIELRAPLVLLPQTYGPFSSARTRRAAEGIVRSAKLAFARDERSFEALRSLLGPCAFDPARHRVGVDVAFGLEAREPALPLPEPARSWLDAPRGERDEVVGFNVSGLLYNRAEEARRRYGLVADYRAVVLGFLGRLLDGTETNVLLVPHVVTPVGHFESDVEACADVAASLGRRRRRRVAVVPPQTDPREAKAIIARVDWFCGTRMHSTIAALSSGVPAAAIAYSRKTLGVFETCGQGEHVVDPRLLSTGACIDRLSASFADRAAAASRLAATLPEVLRKHEAQMDLIARVRRAGTAELGVMGTSFAPMS